MTLQEVSLKLGKAESTIQHAFSRTQKTLAKKGIFLTKEGRWPNIIYNLEYQDINLNTYIVYAHINKINNKKYIGQTRYTLEDRARKNGYGYHDQPKFWHAIQKYGWDNFEHKILYSNLSQEEANIIEIQLIKDLDTIKNGYNVSPGGSYHDPKQIIKGKTGVEAPWYGKKHSEEYKQYMSELMKNKWENEEYRTQTCENMKKNHADFTGKNNPQSKAVYCIEKDIVKDSCGDMAVYLGFERVSGGKVIAAVCRQEKYKYQNYHFVWATEKDNKDFIQMILEKDKKCIYHGRKVICLETNKIYNSQKEASRDTDIDATSIGRCCNGKQKTAGGKHWQLL